MMQYTKRRLCIFHDRRPGKLREDGVPCCRRVVGKFGRVRMDHSWCSSGGRHFDIGHPPALDSSRWFVTPDGVGILWPPSRSRPTGQERFLNDGQNKARDRSQNRLRGSPLDARWQLGHALHAHPSWPVAVAGREDHSTISEMSTSHIETKNLRLVPHAPEHLRALIQGPDF
jgi:hypothetical protein